MKRAQSYEEFWPLYLHEHRHPATRGFHLFGTALAVVLLCLAALWGSWWLLLAAVVVGYAFAWLSHAFIEKNKPATFTHPFWSLISDFRMLGCWLTGRLEGELKRHGVVKPAGE